MEGMAKNIAIRKIDWEPIIKQYKQSKAGSFVKQNMIQIDTNPSANAQIQTTIIQTQPFKKLKQNFEIVARYVRTENNKKIFQTSTDKGEVVNFSVTYPADIPVNTICKLALSSELANEKALKQVIPVQFKQKLS